MPDVEYIRGNDYGGGMGGILYTHRHSGSTTAAVAWTASYQAFGTRPIEKGTNPDPHRANTKEEDATGLLNEGHRCRCLETGAFITRDPAGFIDGPNLYTYVLQNPWSHFDPHGLFEWNWDSFANGVVKGALVAVAVVAVVVAAPAIAATVAVAAGASAVTAAAAASVTSAVVTGIAVAASVKNAPAAVAEVASLATGHDIQGSWSGMMEGEMFTEHGELSPEEYSEKAGEFVGGLAGGFLGGRAGYKANRAGRDSLARRAAKEEANAAAVDGGQGAATGMVSKDWQVTTGRSRNAAGNGPPRQISKDVQAEYNNELTKGVSCGEAHALTKADARGIKMKGGSSATQRVGGKAHGQPLPFCEKCDPVMSARKIRAFDYP